MAKKTSGSAKTKGASRTAGAKRGGGKGSLRVRMYRHGLGDCFLITLPKTDGTPFYIMIDCGIIVGSPNPGIMEEVVESIIADTNGFVDILVVTHEHYDHVSGFAIAQDLFADKPTPGKLAAGKVWLAWTEDPADTLAKRLQRERKKLKEKLAALVAGNMGVKGLVDPIDNALGFFGMEKGKEKAEGKAKARGTGPAMVFVSSLAPVRYCRPTDKPTELPEVKGVRIYVLGPPADEKMLKKTDSKAEVYHLANMGAAQSFFMTLPFMTLAGAEPELLERYQPFERPARYSLKKLDDSIRATPSPRDAHLQFFARSYFGARDAAVPDQSWRRIDATYMDAAAEFALQLDSATNNTSLVLALELIDSKKVLLFVADAQVGNWLSWQNVKWKLDANTTVTASDLLRRTVFYKVGHHGSHNATAKAKGLELMQSDDLVAFIPVNHKMAVKKGWGKMPLPKLVKELNERTQGRLVQADKDYKPPNTSKGKAFAAALTGGPKGKEDLFYEWAMPMS